ncbi:uncharacterized protein LOC134289728 [Aedes albopictus]|uniref:Uncharacterized protein n=1 Tax=Aedes albopictus TaxID=7160 RepID=A0ABM1ZJF0_AEDAL
MTSSSNIDSHFSPAGGGGGGGGASGSNQTPQYPYQQQQQNHLPSQHHNHAHHPNQHLQHAKKQSFPIVLPPMTALVTPATNMDSLTSPIPATGRTISRQRPTVAREAEGKATTLPSRVSQLYYKHGLFLSSYPTCATSIAIAVIIFCW